MTNGLLYVIADDLAEDPWPACLEALEALLALHAAFHFYCLQHGK